MDVISILITITAASTPLLLAATGELITEKSGVLNLGVEGMMLIGAISAFIVATYSNSSLLGVLASAFAGAAMASIFAFLTLIFLANQVATGLALTIFGVGLSALLGANFVGFALEPLPQLSIPALSSIPFIGKLLFGQDLMVYFSFFMLAAVGWILNRTRLGLVLKAIGESHDSAHELGYPVVKIRFLAILYGGAMSGLAGGYLSLAYTPMWAENMTAGRGWIALALVVFATWYPSRVLLGAYIFGAITILQLHAQGWGLSVASQFMSMLPYLATILVLVLISLDKTKIRLNAPQCIGKIFHPSR